MDNKEVPICSILTEKAPAGIVVILLCGRGARRLLAGIFRRPANKEPPPPGRAAYGMIWKDRDPIDEVLVINSSDIGSHGESGSYRICCHGGTAAASAIVSLLITHGAELYPWSHFIVAGTLEYDLLQALLNAEGENQALALAHLYSGGLRKIFVRVLDFLEDSLESASCRPVPGWLRELEESYSYGVFLEAPPRVVITGLPNAGKSTLFNAILGESRALTSPFPGTTRDPVEALFLLNGIPVRLVDTAGHPEKEKADFLDVKSIEAGEEILSSADLELRLVNGKEQERFEPECFERTGFLPVLNKCDLLKRNIRSLEEMSSRGSTPIRIAALHGVGIKELLDETGRRLGIDRLAFSKGPVLFSERQKELVCKAIKVLESNKNPNPLISSLHSYLMSPAR